MLTVFSVLWGVKYDTAYVYALREMVKNNLTIPHKFVCITDHELPGINTILPKVDYPGWWSKINLFEPDMATGPSLYLDLDVVITGNIDYLAEHATGRLSAPANWAQSGHGGIQSSVMAWGGNWNEPALSFDYENDSVRLWGDQEFLWELLGNEWDKIPGVGSYKYHCQSEVPEWMRVMVFHGKPDPHEVKDKWILSYTQTLTSLIKSGLRNTLEMAS